MKKVFCLLCILVSYSFACYFDEEESAWWPLSYFSTVSSWLSFDGLIDFSDIIPDLGPPNPDIKKINIDTNS